MVSHPYICGSCGKHCEARHSGQKYCSVACHNAAMRRVYNLTCQYCGQSFSHRRANQQFCSILCRTQSQVERVSKECQHCGITYEVIPSWTDSKYCSQDCKYAHMRTIRGDKHPLKKPSAVKVCTFCGCTYETKPSIAPRSRFCSKQCHGAWVVQNTKASTSIETRIAALLDDLGLAYQAQKPMAHFLCDFVLRQFRLVIECDGDYWHQLDAVKQRDQRKDAWLTSHGYTVLRLAEHKINGDIEWCRQQIIQLTSQLSK